MSWDVPTGEKCPQCGGAIVVTVRGNQRCDNKDCSYRIKTETTDEPKKTRSSEPTFVSAFEAPPLMDEPNYFDDFNDLE